MQILFIQFIQRSVAVPLSMIFSDTVYDRSVLRYCIYNYDFM